MLTPKLPRNDIHVVPHADELRFGGGENFVGRHPGIEHELQFPREFFLTEPPLSGRAGTNFRLQELLLGTQRGDDRFGCFLECDVLRRVAGEREEFLLIEVDRTSILQHRRFQDRWRRSRDRRLAVAMMRMCAIRAMALVMLVSFGSVDCVSRENTQSLTYAP